MQSAGHFSQYYVYVRPFKKYYLGEHYLLAEGIVLYFIFGKKEQAEALTQGNYVVTEQHQDIFLIPSCHREDYLIMKVIFYKTFGGGGGGGGASNERHNNF